MYACADKQTYLALTFAFQHFFAVRRTTSSAGWRTRYASPPANKQLEKYLVSINKQYSVNMQELTVGRSLLRHFVNWYVSERPLRAFNVLFERFPLFREDGRVDGDSYIWNGLWTRFCLATRQGLRIIFPTEVSPKSNGRQNLAKFFFWNENPESWVEFLFKKVCLFLKSASF